MVAKLAKVAASADVLCNTKAYITKTESQLVTNDFHVSRIFVRS